MKSLFALLHGVVVMNFSLVLQAQVNSGSNGSDGAFNPTSNITVNMADHPTGIYQYTSVNIPSGVTVTFTPNANNTPVVWLVQGNCQIAGTVNLNGANSTAGPGGIGGPGGFAGGNWISSTQTATSGQGPGGGAGGNGSYGSGGLFGTGTNAYGSVYLLPLIGGSGGGASSQAGGAGGGGGGGALLIAASGTITITGTPTGPPGITCGGGYSGGFNGGAGSGGAIRLIASQVYCPSGYINVQGTSQDANPGTSGSGRIRIDSLNAPISGNLIGVVTQGFQSIIIPAAGQGIQLSIASIGGISAPGSPAGVVANPDVIVAAQQVNPLPVVVNCYNIPLGTPISITVNPVTGGAVTATGANNAGTLAASTATIPINMPRGGGIIYATATIGIPGGASAGKGPNPRIPLIAQTGWAAVGGKFVAVEIAAGMAGKQRLSYLTESGKRYLVPGN